MSYPYVANIAGKRYPVYDAKFYHNVKRLVALARHKRRVGEGCECRRCREERKR